MIRLLKIHVQAVLVDDDGESLREIMTEPGVITGAELADYPKRVLEDIAALNAKEETSDA